MRQVEGLLRFALPQFQKEGKLYVTVCVGCTGGRHRSVAVVEELRRRLGGEWDILVRHRDVDAGNRVSGATSPSRRVHDPERARAARARGDQARAARGEVPVRGHASTKDGHEVNGKSIMGVLMLVASKGTTVTIKAKGDRARRGGRRDRRS